MRGSAARIVLRTSMRIVTRNPIVLIPEVSARSAVMKKTLHASMIILTHRGMGATGRKFAAIAGKPLTGAQRTVRIRMVIGSIILLLSIGGMALAMIAAAVASISTVVILPARNTMNMTIQSTP